MAGGASSGADDEVITDINVTPLVDIMLVLLIIFMLTANLIDNPSIEVDLPQASTGEATEPTTLGLVLNTAGEIYLNGELTTEEALKTYLADTAKRDPKAQAIIAADKDVSHGQVIHLIDVVRQMGVFRFALNIDPSTSVAVPNP